MRPMGASESDERHPMFPRPTASPVAEPITLAEAIAHLNEVSDGGEIDAKVTRMITAARESCEIRTGRVLVTTPFLLTLPEWPCADRTNPLGMIDLKIGPLIAVQSVQYLDDAGTLQTLASDQYKVYTHLSTGMIGRAYGVSWPSVQSDVMDAVRVAFTAGYGATASTVPTPLKQWILLAIGDMYENRNASAERPVIPQGFGERLLDPYVILGH